MLSHFVSFQVLWLLGNIGHFVQVFLAYEIGAQYFYIRYIIGVSEQGHLVIPKVRYIPNRA